MSAQPHVDVTNWSKNFHQQPIRICQDKMREISNPSHPFLSIIRRLNRIASECVPEAKFDKCKLNQKEDCFQVNGDGESYGIDSRVITYVNTYSHRCP